jgi:hypothetical protein
MSSNPKEERDAGGKSLPAFPIPLMEYEKLASGGHDAAGV